MSKTLTQKIQKDFDRIALLEQAKWNHNNHYHDFLLKQLPSDCESILEIGCGTDPFTRFLAERSDRVVAIDLSPKMIDFAKFQDYIENQQTSYLELTMNLKHLITGLISISLLIDLAKLQDYVENQQTSHLELTINLKHLITGLISIALLSEPLCVPGWARTFSGTGITPDGTKVIYALDNNHGKACIKINNVYAIGWIKSDSSGNFTSVNGFVFQGATATLKRPGNTFVNVRFKTMSMSSKDPETQKVYEGCNNLPPSLK